MTGEIHTKQVNVNEADYFIELMQNWFEKSKYTKKEHRNKMYVYYWEGMSYNEVNEIYEDAKKEVDRINNEILGTDKAENVNTNKQTELFSAKDIYHKPYNIKEESWRDGKSLGYLIEMTCTEDGLPTGDIKKGYFIYPGIYLEIA